MSDKWEELIFDPANFDGIDLDILSTDDDLSNELIRHTYPFRDGAVLQNAGAVPRTTACEIWFFERPELEDDHLERVRQFAFAAATREARVFLHPLFGRFNAMVEGLTFQASATERDLVKASCTFVEQGLNPAAFEAQSDASVGAGVAAVSQAGAVIDGLVLAAPAEGAVAGPGDVIPVEGAVTSTVLETVTVQDTALTTAQRWADTEGITQRQINLELNQITNEIDAEIDRLDLSTNVVNYDTWIAFVRLHGAIRRAAELAIRTAPKLTTHIVRVTAPLISIMADIYGGSLAVEKYSRTLELNNIDNPSRVLVGTVLAIEL